jgi:uncharacterized protein DUF3592
LAYQDQLASIISDTATKLLNNRTTFFRYMRFVQAFLGLLLVAFSSYIGKDHFHLMRAGDRAQGEIIGYKQKEFERSSGPSSSALMPIVEYRAGDRVVHFQDWFGTQAGVLHVRVTVLYDPANPSDAMIDRPVMNWIPWAPAFAVGAFLLIVAVFGWLRDASRQ